MITRNTLAILLETKPSNVKSFKQVDNNIYIKLGNLSEELSMPVREYQNCLEQLRQNKKHINLNNFATIAIIIGTFIATTVSAINIDLANQQDSAERTQLMSDRHRK